MYFELTKGTLVVLALLLLVAIGLLGCSHQVMTFFFTGVPEPGQEQVADSTVKPVKRKQRVIKSNQFAHGPYAAGSCNLCHQSLSGSVFDQQVTAAASTNPRKVSPRLLISLGDLCVGCHSDQQPSAARSLGLWQHGPVANRLCTVCHSPHKSSRQYMLLADSNAAMCGRCHSSIDLRHTRQHTDNPAAECTRCHNPHAGQNRFLLKTEYDEWSRFDES